MKKFKKLLSAVLSSAIATTSLIPFCSFAEEHIKGDVNCNGIVDYNDVQLVLRYYADNVAGTPDNIPAEDIENILKYGDVNGDGEVDATDATYILNCITLDFNGDGAINTYDTHLILEYYADKILDQNTVPDEYAEKIGKYGDINGDGEADATDASCLMRILIEMTDANDDGVVDINDAVFFYDIAMNLDSYSEEEIKSFVELTAEVRYDSSPERMKKSFIDYSYDVAEVLTDFQKGDVNGDGQLNASDASDVMSLYADISSGSVSDINSGKYKLIRFMGDMDEDGIIKASDASAILSAYADISAGSEQ